MEKENISELVKEGTVILGLVKANLNESITMFKRCQIVIDTRATKTRNTKR